MLLAMVPTRLKISYSIESTIRDWSGITKAIHLFDEPFIVVSGDIWTDFNFSHLKLSK